MSFYSIRKFSLLSPLDVMNRFAFRFLFARWTNKRMLGDVNVAIFSDEDYFPLGGYNNNQNFSSWGSFSRTSGLTKANASITSNISMRLVEQRHHCSILLCK